MPLPRAIFALVLTAVVSSGVTAFVVNKHNETSDNQVVRELQRQDQVRKTDEAAAKKWATQPSALRGKY